MQRAEIYKASATFIYVETPNIPRQKPVQERPSKRALSGLFWTLDNIHGEWDGIR
jgi:hypothetical protein